MTPRITGEMLRKSQWIGGIGIARATNGGGGLDSNLVRFTIFE